MCMRVIMNRERVCVNACDDLTKGVLVCACWYVFVEKESLVIK